MPNEMELKYGLNPDQKPARIFMEGGELPVTVLNGRPGYINFLDALNGWQLVNELSRAVGLPAATSFKHVSPAGAAVGEPLSESLARSYFVDGMELSPLACAYARARGADRLSSFGDFIALSHECDVETARLIAREVSDGVIAPGYEAGALKLLQKKRGGAYNVIKIDRDYTPDPIERKQVFGITFEQRRATTTIGPDLLQNIVTRKRDLPDAARRDLLISLITLKYTQSNSVCYAKGGQAIGVGAGQQSRVHCVRLAGDKADIWHLRQHPKTLALRFREGLGRPERDNAVDMYLSRDNGRMFNDGAWQMYFADKPERISEDERAEWLAGVNDVSLGSDAFFPFSDSIERAAASGVRYIAQPGGSMRDADVIAACNELDITMAFTGLRLFHH